MRAVRNSVTCVALDLGTTAVRAVELEWTGSAGDSGETRVLRRGVAPVPPGTWNNLSQHRDSLVAAIQQALSAGGIAARSVVACLPRSFVTLRMVNLPHASAEEMRGMIAFEAQQYILYPLDEVILAYQVLAAPRNAAGIPDVEMETVLLAAARRGLIAELMTVFDRTGLELRQLSVSALALAEHVRDGEEPTALIDYDAGELDVAVVAGRQLLFTRAGAPEIHGAPADVVEHRVLEEIVRSFTAYQNAFRTLPLTHVYTIGSSAVGHASGWLEQALTDTLELPVSTLNSRFLPAGDSDLRAYAIAVGMALQALPGSLAPINLVPGDRAELKAQQARKQRRTLALAALGVALLAVAWSIQGALARQAKANRDAIEANDNLDSFNKRLATRQKAYDNVATLDNDLEQGLDRKHPVVDVMVALSNALPKSQDIWLTELSFTRGGLLTLRGETKAAMLATDLVLDLQKSGAFNQVRLSYMGDAQQSDTGTGVAQAAGSTASAATNTPAANAAASSATVTPLPGMPPATGSGAAAGTPAKPPSHPAASAPAGPANGGAAPIAPASRRGFGRRGGQGAPPPPPPAPGQQLQPTPVLPPTEAPQSSAATVAPPGNDVTTPPNSAPRVLSDSFSGTGPAGAVQTGTNPAPPDAGAAFGGRRFGRRRRNTPPSQPSPAQSAAPPIGQPGASATPSNLPPVPSISTPPGGIQRRPGAPAGPTAPAAAPKPQNADHNSLTAFVITCRLNLQAGDLVRQYTRPPVQTASHAPKFRTAMKGRNRHVHAQ